MNVRFWSFVLSWSRVGINAAMFLIAARFLSLAEIGLFATAFAVVRLLQGVQKAGVSDSVTLFGHRPNRWNTLFALSCGFGVLGGGAIAVVGALINPLILILAIIPVVNGLGAVSEGILRYRLEIKKLALRTLVVQSVSGFVAIWMLTQDYGVWALVAFVLCNAVCVNVLSLIMARWSPETFPTRRQYICVAAAVSQVAGRVALTSSTIPLAQLAIGLVLGPVAAGAFQIATRILELIDALTLAPLRFVALPQLKTTQNLAQAVRSHTCSATVLAAAIWSLVIALPESLLSIAVGSAHAEAVAPLLRCLALIGLSGAVSMPLTQALTAAGHTKLVLKRSALSLALCAVLMGPALAVSLLASNLALSFGVTLATLWLVWKGAPLIDLRWSDAVVVVPPLCVGGTIALLLNWLPFPLWAQFLAGVLVLAGALGLSQRYGQVAV